MKMLKDRKLKEIEVLRSCCGEDEEGYSRAGAVITMLRLKGEEQAEKVDEAVFDNPVINIYRDVRRTMIDLSFMDIMDHEFTNVVMRLQAFVTERISMGCEAVPSVMVTLAPKEYFGRYYISALHGMWFLMPSAAGGSVDTIRFIFDNDCVSCFEVSDEDELYEEEDIYEQDSGVRDIWGRAGGKDKGA